MYSQQLSYPGGDNFYNDHQEFDLDDGLDLRQFEYSNRAPSRAYTQVGAPAGAAALLPSATHHVNDAYHYAQNGGHFVDKHTYENDYYDDDDGGYSSRRQTNVPLDYQDNIILRTHPDYDNTPYYDDSALVIATNPRKPVSSRQQKYYDEPPSTQSLRRNHQEHYHSVKEQKSYNSRSSTRNRSQSYVDHKPNHRPKSRQESDHQFERNSTSRKSNRSTKQDLTQTWVDTNKSKKKNGQEKVKRFPEPDKKAPRIPLPDYDGASLDYVPEPDY